MDYAIAEAYRIAGVKDKAEEFYKKAADIRKGEPQLPREELPDEFFDDDSAVAVAAAVQVPAWPMRISCWREAAQGSD